VSAGLSLAPELVERIASVYGLQARDLQLVTGGNYNSVYAASVSGRDAILRVAPPEEEITPASTRAVISWLLHAAAGGGAVPRPIASARGSLVEVLETPEGIYTVTAYVRSPGLCAQDLPAAHWSDGLRRAFGHAVGRLHALSRAYLPTEPALRRPSWQEVGSCFRPVDTMGSEQAPLIARRDMLLARVGTLPRDAQSYGLVHADLHLGNVLVASESAQVTVIDWDDACYGWYAMDIALPLFDALVLCAEEEREVQGERFLRGFLRGYREESAFDGEWVLRLPLFLSLLELSIYTQVHRGVDPPDPDGWIGRFMRGRYERMVADQSYVDLDWAALARLATL
jgi:amicoumacin kinase